MGREEGKVEGLVVEGEICQAALVVVQLSSSQRKQRESTEKLRWRSSGAKTQTDSFLSRNGLAGGDNLESCPRVFTVYIFRSTEYSCRLRLHIRSQIDRFFR